MNAELQALGEAYLQMVRREIHSLLHESDKLAVRKEVNAIEAAMKVAHSAEDGQMIDEIQFGMIALEKRLFLMERHGS